MFYATDSWKVTPKLTVNYGLRYELEPPYLRQVRSTSSTSHFKWDNTVLPVYVRAGNGDFYGGNPPPPSVARGVPYYAQRDVRKPGLPDLISRTSRRGSEWPKLESKTVIRAGGGIYYVRDIGNAQFDLVRNAPFSTRRSENAQSALIPSLNCRFRSCRRRRLRSSW